MLGAVLEAPVAKQTVVAGLRHGVVLNAPSASVVRFTPPLVISEDELEQAAQRFAAASNETRQEEKE